MGREASNAMAPVPEAGFRIGHDSHGTHASAIDDIQVMYLQDLFIQRVNRRPVELAPMYIVIRGGLHLRHPESSLD